jgi:hypothetical protein
MLMMQRRHHQVPGPGQRNGRFHGHAVADLADQDDVRRRAHRHTQGVLETARVEAHLALVDDGLLVGVQELDRVLDREDVVRRAQVAMIDHRRERRGLARTRRPDHQHQPALHHHQVGERIRQAEIG